MKWGVLVCVATTNISGKYPIFLPRTRVMYFGVYILQMTREFNQKYRVFPRHFLRSEVCLCAYHKYFGEIPDIFLPCHIYFKRPGNLIRNIRYFPDICNEVWCACSTSVCEEWGKLHVTLLLQQIASYPAWLRIFSNRSQCTFCVPSTWQTLQRQGIF